MKVIKIEKNLIPCRFFILLGGERFTLHLRYNARADMITVDLYQGETLISAGEPLVYGVPLWKDVAKEQGFPKVTITPVDPSGEANRVTWDNLFDTVLLEVTENG